MVPVTKLIGCPEVAVQSLVALSLPHDAAVAGAAAAVGPTNMSPMSKPAKTS